jgi:poly(ADP-ribose) glycohydrolase ARH3
MAGAGLDAICGAMVGVLAGDCVGAPYEGSRPVAHTAAGRRVARALARRPVLRYTDDTQLTLALTDHLVDDDDRVEPVLLVRRMAERYDARRGYGAGMRRLVGLWRDGWDPEAAATGVFPDGSYGNGAAMRVAPVGLRWAGTPQQLTDAATRSARVTHVHPVGVDGAVVQAHAVAHAALAHAFTLADLTNLPAMTAPVRDGLIAAAQVESDAPAGQVADLLGTAPVAHRSVPAALWCAATSDDVAGAVTRAVGLGGDTDTIAAMAAAVRGAATGVAGVPPTWTAVLEGHAEVLAAAQRLHARVTATTGDRT